MKRTRLRPVSPKRKSRVGKLGIVRLVGKDLAELRLQCFERDGWRCQKCGVIVRDVPLSLDLHRAEMAHIHAKRNGGDTLDNVQTLCASCHKREHAGGKPCPPKPKPPKD